MKYVVSLLLMALLLGNTISAFAQIGMGGQPHPSAVLDLKSPANDKAFYPPRLTTAQRLAISSPQAGALVYDLDKNTLYLHDGQSWLPLATTNNSNLIPIDRIASDGKAPDYFGYSVAISGDYAIVGAYNKNMAYIFVRSGTNWNQQARLIASDGAGNDYFGYSVAISGDYAIVGAYQKTIGSNGSQGAAYVFVRSGTNWNQQARLTASDGTAGNWFGYSVAISGDYAVVGAYTKTIGSNNQQGAGYVFARSGTNWIQQAILTASDAAAGDYFGGSVSISGDYAIVGAASKTVGSNLYQGVVYVFARSGTNWAQQAKLIASDGIASDAFGGSIAISGDYAMVGVNNNYIQREAVYIFTRSGNIWNQQAKLTASDVGNFGRSVAISGNYAIVGASSTIIDGNISNGAAYIFVRSGSTWTQTRQVTSADPANTENGKSVGLSNGTFIIGGPSYQFNKGKVAFGTVD
jgi:hypothetical protein